MNKKGKKLAKIFNNETGKKVIMLNVKRANPLYFKVPIIHSCTQNILRIHKQAEV